MNPCAKAMSGATTFNCSCPLICWVDGAIRDDSIDTRNVIDKLQGITREIITHTNAADAENYINDLQSVQVFVITSGTLCQELTEKIHSNKNVCGIYVYCRNPQYLRTLLQTYPIIKIIERKIDPICAHIRESLSLPPSSPKPSTPSSPAPSTVRLDQLDASFRLTQLLKYAILTLEHDNQSLARFTQYSEKISENKARDLPKIQKFQNDYQPNGALQWFIRDGFLSRMLEQALTECQAHVLKKVAFFIKDLHNQLVKINSDRSNSQWQNGFTVYRVQEYSKEDFQRLKQNSNRYISFNNFLLTRKDQRMAESIARDILTNPKIISVLFTIKIDPKKTSIPWVEVKNEDSSHVDELVVFDLHTVFRLDSISSKDGSDQLYEIELTLVSINDNDIQSLIEPLGQKLREKPRWNEVAEFFVVLKEFRNAAAIYEVLYNEASNNTEKSLYAYSLGLIVEETRDKSLAGQWYEIALRISEQHSLPSDPQLATMRFNIGSLYFHMNNYPKALPFLKKALETLQNNCPIPQPQVQIIRRMIQQISTDSN